MKKSLERNIEMDETYCIRPGKHATERTNEILYIVKNGKVRYGIKINQK